MSKKPRIVYTESTGKKGEYKIYSVKTKDLLGTIKGDNKKSYWEAFDTDNKFLISGSRKKECMDYFRDMDTKRLMAKGGGVNLENINNLKENDLVIEYRKDSKYKEGYFVGKHKGRIIQIVGAMAKVSFEPFGTEEWIALRDLIKYEDFIKPSKSRMAEGGGIGFEKLSKQVAKEYEGDKVAPKYQHEYGKTYSKSEAKEVGNKVAGKVYWQQQGRMATGGNIKKYEYSPSIEEQKTWDEKKTRIYDAYVNSYNSYQDLLQERKRAIGRNDKDEVKSIDLRLKNKLLAIRFAYSELKGRFYEEDFKDGGNLDSLDARISKAIFQAYGDIDDAIEFKFNDPDSGVAPYRLVFLAVVKGWIEPEEINKDVLNSAYETSSETADAEEIGSSDMNSYVFYMLRDAGFDMKVENGTYTRVRNKLATGGTTSGIDEYRRKRREAQAKEEEGKYFPPFKVYVYEQNPSGAYQFNNFETPNFHDAVKWAKDEIAKTRSYRKDANRLWATVSEFVPIEERQNEIYAYSEVARFGEEDMKKMKFENGGSMSSGSNGFYIVLADGSKKEYAVNNITEIPNIYFAMGTNGIDKGTPMVHHDNILTSVFYANGTPVEAMPQYAGKDYWDFKNKMATGGNLKSSDSDSYYRWRVKKFGFKPYGKENGRFKITYVADGESQEEIWATKEMAIDTAKRYTKLFEDVKIFDGSGSEIKYEKGGSVGKLNGANYTLSETEKKNLTNYLIELGIPKNLIKIPTSLPASSYYGFLFRVTLSDGEMFGIGFSSLSVQVNGSVGSNGNKPELFIEIAGKTKGEKKQLIKDSYYIQLSSDFSSVKKMAKGGLVVTSIKDIPNFKEELEAGRITYRGLGLGKLWNDFYKIAGEIGTRIKVKGKEYYITMTEFNTFSRDSSGKMRIKFDAPHRRFEKGGNTDLKYSVTKKPDESGLYYIVYSESGTKVPNSKLPKNIGYGSIKNEFEAKRKKYDASLGLQDAVFIVKKMNEAEGKMATGGNLHSSEFYKDGGEIVDAPKKNNIFIAQYNGKEIELEARSMFDAEKKAVEQLKVPKSKRGLLSVMNKKAYEKGDFQFN